MAEEFYLKIPDIAYFLTIKKHSEEYNKMEEEIRPYLARMNLKDWDMVAVAFTAVPLGRKIA